MYQYYLPMQFQVPGLLTWHKIWHYYSHSAENSGMDDDTSGLVDPAILETDGKQFAYQAVEYDKTGNYPMAVFYYNVRII